MRAASWNFFCFKTNQDINSVENGKPGSINSLDEVVRAPNAAPSSSSLRTPMQTWFNPKYSHFVHDQKQTSRQPFTFFVEIFLLCIFYLPALNNFPFFIYCLTWAIEWISSSSLYRNRKWFVCIEWCLSLLMMKLKRFLSSTFDISVQFTNFNVFSFRNLFFFLSQFYCLYNYKWRKRKTHIHIKMQMQIFCG